MPWLCFGVFVSYTSCNTCTSPYTPIHLNLICISQLQPLNMYLNSYYSIAYVIVTCSMIPFSYSRCHCLMQLIIISVSTRWCHCIRFCHGAMPSLLSWAHGAWFHVVECLSTMVPHWAMVPFMSWCSITLLCWCHLGPCSCCFRIDERRCQLVGSNPSQLDNSQEA